MKLSIVIPIYNEKNNLAELLQRLQNTLQKCFCNDQYEIIFVDDGSTDDSFSIISCYAKNNTDIKVLRFSRNFGHHIAVTAGLDHTSGDSIITMDGDLQDRPEEIINLYERLREGYDVVYGKRVKRQCPWWERVASDLFVKIIRFLINEDIEINTDIFRIMTKQVVQEVRRLREHNRYVIGLIGWVGFKHSSIPVVNGKRFAGTSHYGFIKRLKLALDAIFSFSDFVLRLISKIGLLLVMISGLGVIWIVYRWWCHGQVVQGWASLIVSLSFFSGLQIFILGVIAEYISRLYMESKQRPLYVLRSKTNL